MPNKYTQTPWKVLPLKGKHYGTIIDCGNDEEIRIWGMGEILTVNPSKRQLEDYGNPVRGTEEWREIFCDTHYESVEDLDFCELIVSAVNAAAKNDGGGA